MNVRELLTYMVTLWLLPCASMVAWGWSYVISPTPIPLWVNTLLGVGFILWLIAWVGAPAAWLAKWRAVRAGSWIFLILVALVVALNASLDRLDRYFDWLPLNRLAQRLHWPVQLLVVPNNYLSQLNQACRSGTGLPQTTLMQLALFGLALWLTTLTAVTAGHVVWLSAQQRLRHPLDALCTHLRRSPLRIGRILGWLRRALIVGLLLSGALVGLAVTQNVSELPIRWQLAKGSTPVPPSVQALVLDERDGTLYVGTDNGVFISHNGGANWQAASDGLRCTHVEALVLDGRNGTLYAGTGNSAFVSRDGSASWQAAADGLPDTNVKVLALDERNGTLYAWTGVGGVFVSRDGGARWQTTGIERPFPNVSALFLDGRDGTLYAGGYGGVSVSHDGGASWQATSGQLPDAYVHVLLDGLDGTLYAGTGGVFVSHDGGVSWQDVSTGLMGAEVHALVMDMRDGTLYAGTSDRGVFVSHAGRAHWQSANTGLTSTDVRALVLDVRDGTLYAGTGGGVFISRDGGVSWQAASDGLVGNRVRSLALDERDGTLYVGTNGSVFVSHDGGVTWQAASAGLASTYVLVLALDRRDGTLYAGTDGGVFVSRDGGVSWQGASTGPPLYYVQALVLDGQTDTIYAGTRAGVFISRNGGASWQAASDGLVYTNVRALVLDRRDGTLYAGTSDLRCGRGGVFVSHDGGASWQIASAGPTKACVWTLALDGLDGTLYAGSYAGVILSRAGSASWQAAADGVFAGYSWPDLFSTGSSAVILGGTDGALIYTSEGAAWIAWRGSFTQPVVLHRLPGGRATVLNAFGSSSYAIDLSGRLRPIPTAWLALRALAWRAQHWTTTNFRYLLGGLALAIALLLAFDYTGLNRPFGLPLWATLFARHRLDTYARPEKLDAAWVVWESLVHAELARHGDVTPDDLRSIPAPFRRYALRRYAQTHETRQALEAQPGRLRLQTGARLRRWHTAWAAAVRALGRPSGRIAVEQLATLLTEALGFTPDPTRDCGPVYAQQVEAPALRLNVPPRFPLLFITDPRPGRHTLQALADTVDVLREGDFFALVVPLEPLARQTDAAEALRQAVIRSPHAHGLVVISSKDALEILATRYPLQALEHCILAWLESVQAGMSSEGNNESQADENAG